MRWMIDIAVECKKILFCPLLALPGDPTKWPTDVQQAGGFNSKEDAKKYISVIDAIHDHSTYDVKRAKEKALLSVCAVLAAATKEVGGLKSPDDIKGVFYAMMPYAAVTNAHCATDPDKCRMKTAIAMPGLFVPSMTAKTPA